MKNDKIVLYMHAGSDNHGCEAIANTLIKMLPKPAVLISSRKAEDEKYSLQGLCSQIIQEKYIEKNLFIHTWYYFGERFFMIRNALCVTAMGRSVERTCTGLIFPLAVTITAMKICWKD